MCKLKKLKKKQLQEFFNEKIETQLCIKVDGERIAEYKNSCVVMAIKTRISKQILLEIWFNEKTCIVRKMHRVLMMRFDVEKLFKDWKQFLKKNLKNFCEEENIIEC